eukprot:4094889-Pleurochrysis_carterae.AAC.1
MQVTLEAAGAAFVTFAQCAFGAQVRKYTTLACAAALRGELRPFAEARCTHGPEGHDEVAHGRDEGGRARAARAAAYPPGMNAALAA